jgi:subtilisin family serine protease
MLAGTREVHKNAIVVSEDITHGWHGTKMATIAAGKQLGIAPNADLYLIKAKGNWAKDAETAGYQSFGYQVTAISEALDQIRLHIQTRLNSDRSAKSVINMSWGKFDLNNTKAAVW